MSVFQLLPEQVSACQRFSFCLANFSISAFFLARSPASVAAKLSRIPAEGQTTKYTNHTKTQAAMRILKAEDSPLNGEGSRQSTGWALSTGLAAVSFVYFVYFVVAIEWLRLSSFGFWG